MKPKYRLRPLFIILASILLLSSALITIDEVSYLKDAFEYDIFSGIWGISNIIYLLFVMFFGIYLIAFHGKNKVLLPIITFMFVFAEIFTISMKYAEPIVYGEAISFDSAMGVLFYNTIPLTLLSLIGIFALLFGSRKKLAVILPAAILTAYYILSFFIGVGDYTSDFEYICYCFDYDLNTSAVVTIMWCSVQFLVALSYLLLFATNTFNGVCRTKEVLRDAEKANPAPEPEPVIAPKSEPVTAAAPAPVIEYTPIVTEPESDADIDVEAIEQTLEGLKNLYDRGIITKEEYFDLRMKTISRI